MRLDRLVIVDVLELARRQELAFERAIGHVGRIDEADEVAAGEQSRQERMRKMRNRKTMTLDMARLVHRMPSNQTAMTPIHMKMAAQTARHSITSQ